MSRIIRFESPPGKPALRGIHHFWKCIRGLDRGGPWTIHDVVMESNVSDRSTVADFVRRLLAARIAEPAPADPSGPSRRAPTYRLLSSPEPTPMLRRDGSAGLQGRGQAQMWNAMRGICRQGFTVDDLVLYASTDIVPVTTETAKSYVKHLAAAGFFRRLREGRPRERALYRLRPGMDTGPQAPVILRTHVVYDQNKGVAVGPLVAEEVSS